MSTEPGNATAQPATLALRCMAIDNHRMARIALLAGCPMEKSAGVDLLKKPGRRVEKGEVRYRLHAHFQADFRLAPSAVDTDNGYQIGGSRDVSRGVAEI